MDDWRHRRTRPDRDRLARQDCSLGPNSLANQDCSAISRQLVDQDCPDRQEDSHQSSLINASPLPSRIAKIRALLAAALVCSHEAVSSEASGGRRWAGFSHQILLLAIPSIAYFGVRSLSAGQRHEAMANAASIVKFERSVGLDWEHVLQQRILHLDWLIDIMNWIYIWGHFPVIVLALAGLYGLRRKQYRSLRDALVVSGSVGLICFVLWPVAPPRLYDPQAFFDSLNTLSGSYRVLQNPTLTNQFAAVPSFHVGWNLLVAAAVWNSTSHRLVRAAVALFPVAMSITVVLTANHWLVDIVAGVAVAALGVLGATLARRFLNIGPQQPSAVAADSWSAGRDCDQVIAR